MIGWRLTGALAILLAAAVAGSCRAPVDLKEAVQIVDVTSGWFDAGIVDDNKNKLVPSVSFRLRKADGVPLESVSLNVIFRHPPAEGSETEDEWDDVFVQNAAFSEGSQTPLLAIRPEKGYTGEQSRLELLQHSQFRDVRARVFARYGSNQWAELGLIDVQRQLLTR